MENKILYLCNRKKCENCSYPTCKHTTDIDYAVNFEKNEADCYEEKHEQKRIVVPFNIGDTLYVISEKVIEQQVVEYAQYSLTTKEWLIPKKDDFYYFVLGVNAFIDEKQAIDKFNQLQEQKELRRLGYCGRHEG